MIGRGDADGADAPKGDAGKPFDYPEARKSDVADDYHGTKVADPYRWLEDPDSPETRAWVEAENKVTFAFLEAIPARPRLRERLTKLWDYEKFGVPSKEGGRYFYTRNSGLQNQSVLYTTTSLDDEAEAAARPEHALEGRHRRPLGPGAERRRRTCSPTGSPSAGSDWQEWKVRDVKTGARPARPPEVDQVLERLVDQGRQGLLLRPLPRAEGRRRPQGGQLPPEALFPQARHPAGRRRPRLRTPRPEGMAVPRRRHRRRPIPRSSPSRRGPTTSTASSTRTSKTQGAKPVELIDNFEHEYTFIDNDGPVFWFKTERRRPPRPADRHRHPQARPRRLAGGDPAGGRDARQRRPRRRPVPGDRT